MIIDLESEDYPFNLFPELPHGSVTCVKSEDPFTTPKQPTFYKCPVCHGYTKGTFSFPFDKQSAHCVDCSDCGTYGHHESCCLFSCQAKPKCSQVSANRFWQLKSIHPKEKLYTRHTDFEVKDFGIPTDITKGQKRQMVRFMNDRGLPRAFTDPSTEFTQLS